MVGRNKDIHKEYTLDYSKKKLTDDALLNEPFLNETRKSYSFEEVDFSSNAISSKGLQTVLNICHRCNNLKVLKLFRNHIDDEGADGLATLVEEVRSIEEIHISHNQITGTGARRLVKAAAERYSRRDDPPLWLRLEQNVVMDSASILEDLQSKGHSICAREDEIRCTTRRCCYGCKVHLPHFCWQKGDSGKGKGKGKG
eukprot:CAMPEP_0180763782 /NCGR_PEP_ID=MMETSP1038_2-20121128/38092_1 /TAXON_ID=632150 /ORGANISM="Azadinium spinosum, Strain 3D9" /LENGTH=198 /DNA_ID=CAMNT_0022798143 /DNA_START=30 /DNA_END=622 /DNA_ORIENTATION=-